MALLSASDLATLRGPDWIADEIDSHTEWGSSTVAGAAAAGATSLQLQGLAASGTITARTTFSVISGSTREDYQVSANVTITAPVAPATTGTATVALLRPLVYAARVGDRVEVRQFKRSVYNRQTSEQFFEDAELEEFAVRAERRYARIFADADDPQSLRYQAVTVLALEAQMASSRYEASIAQSADQGRDHFARLEARIARLKKALLYEVTGSSHTVMSR